MLTILSFTYPDSEIQAIEDSLNNDIELIGSYCRENKPILNSEKGKTLFNKISIHLVTKSISHLTLSKKFVCSYKKHVDVFVYCNMFVET